MLYRLQSCKHKNSLQVACQEKSNTKTTQQSNIKTSKSNSKTTIKANKNHNKHIPLAMMFWFMYTVIVYQAKQRFLREWFSHGRTGLLSPALVLSP